MKIRTFACLVGLIGLQACAGGGSARTDAPLTASAAKLTQIAPAGVVQSSMSTKRIVLDTTARAAQGVYGGSPAFTQSVQLYDAPLAGFSAVNVALTEIDAVSSTGTIVPMLTFSTPHVVNLLSLQSTPLAIGGTIPAGPYAGLRLLGIVSQSSAVTTGGTTMPVTVAGASGDDFTLSVGATFGSAAAGSSASVSLDFNLAESMAYTFTNGSGTQQQLVLKPLLIAQPAAGVLQGIAVNASGSGVSEAIVALIDGNGNVVNTTISAADGSFTVHALRYGTYQIEIYNAYRNAAGSLFKATNADGAPGAQYYGPTVTIAAPVTNVGSVQD
jgi:hypothetical protein